MNFKDLIKKFNPIHVLMVGIIILFNALFFMPQIEGKKVKAHDAVSSTAWTKHVTEFQTNGETMNWNPAIFCGMPWGLLAKGAKSNLLRFTNNLSHAYFKYPMGYMIKASLLCYLALVLLRLSPMLSMGLALVYAFNANHLILIGAGHANKVEVIAGFPILIAGILLAYRGKVLLAFFVLTFSVSLAILRVHPQMFYYLLMVLAVLGLVFMVFAFMEKKFLAFFKVSAIIILAFILGAGTNVSQLISSKDFAKDTMRGAPILEQAQEDKVSSSNVEGLDWEYAMRWSNEAKDLWTILIPRAMGGGSEEEIGTATETPLAKILASSGQKPKKDGNYLYGLYFGNLDSSGGPFYTSVLVVLLFAFSFFTLGNKTKIAFALSILFLFTISMGKNFFFNEFLFDYLPYFNKWRAHSSIMSVFPGVLIIAAGIGIQAFMKEENKSKFIKPILYSGGGLIVLSLVYWIYALSSFSFIQEWESSYQFEVQSAIIETRKLLLKQDVLRTLFLLGLGTGLLFLHAKNILKKPVFVILFVLIALFDVLQIDYRYLDGENWVNENSFLSDLAARPVDQQIFNLEKNGRGQYRVFDQSISTFTSSFTSYHHNTIGGYRPDKLQRFQDIIENQISKGNMQVLNMLNSKYFITPEQQLSINNQANGVAWFVSEVKEVSTPNEEIGALDSLNTKTQAVVLKSEFDKQSYDNVGNGTGAISLVGYNPMKMVYNTNNTTDQFAVFSEVWYGRNDVWRAYIDGKEADIVRVNYILRGLEVPANAKEIVFEMNPSSKYGWISTAISGFVLLLLILALVFRDKIEEKLDFVTE